MDNIVSELSQKLQKPWVEEAVLKKLAVHFDTNTNKIKEVIKCVIDFSIRKGDLPIDFYVKEQIADCDIVFEQKRPIDNSETYAFNAIFLQLVSGGKILIHAEVFEYLLKQGLLSHEHMVRGIYCLEEVPKQNFAAEGNCTYNKLWLEELKKEGCKIVYENSEFELEITDEFLCPFCGSRIDCFEIKTTFDEIKPSVDKPTEINKYITNMVMYPIGCYPYCTFPKKNFVMIRKRSF